MTQWVPPLSFAPVGMTLMGGDRAGDQVVASAFAFQIVADNSRSDDPGMSDHVYKKIELVGSSPNSIEDAVANAIARAGQTVRNMRWFEVTETRGHLEDGKIGHWQVTVKVGFTLD